MNAPLHDHFVNNRLALASEYVHNTEMIDPEEFSGEWFTVRDYSPEYTRKGRAATVSKEYRSDEYPYFRIHWLPEDMERARKASERDAVELFAALSGRDMRTCMHCGKPT